MVAFAGYLKHSQCYKEQRPSTGRCISDFSSEVRRITSVDFEEYHSYSEEGTEELYAPGEELDDDDPDKIMCRWEFFRFNRLVSCPPLLYRARQYCHLTVDYYQGGGSGVGLIHAALV